MVLKTTLCRFSGLRIYPGRALLYVRTDCTQWLFLSKKCRMMFNNKMRPAKLAWTFAYRKAHKKDQVRACMRERAWLHGASPPPSAIHPASVSPNHPTTQPSQVNEAARKKRRGSGKAAVRTIGSVSIDVLNKKRTEKPEVRCGQWHTCTTPMRLRMAGGI
jgi:large subunit ribosomal protein L24e